MLLKISNILGSQTIPELMANNRLCTVIVELIFDPKASADYVIKAIETLYNQENSEIGEGDLEKIFNSVKTKVQNLPSVTDLNQGQRDIVNAFIRTAMYALCMAYPAAVSIDHKNPAYFVLALVFLIVMDVVARKVKKNDDNIQEQKLRDIYNALLEKHPELNEVPSGGDDASSYLADLEL